MRELDLSVARWRKSTRSDASNICVEAALVGEVVGLRDSKNPDGPVLAIPATSFTALKDTLR